jgi:hypothetical protein
MDTEVTSVLPIACCSCGAKFRRSKEGGWRQKSLYILADPGALYAYICGRCCRAFSSEQAIGELLDTELEAQAIRYTRRLAVC